jgi:hypothetical protein
MVCLFYFHSFSQDYYLTCPENHMEKGISHLLTRDFGYKKTNELQLLNKLILAK